jgi:TRAP-type uncharacterized transport system fused permease subunit
MLIMVQGFTVTELVMSTLACIASITFFSAAFAGWFLAPMAAWERGLIAIAGMPMIVARPATIAISLALAAPVLLSQIRKRAMGPGPQEKKLASS